MDRYDTPKYTRSAFFIQSSLSLFFCLLLFFFISTRKNLRSTRSNQLFLNILLVHIMFSIAEINTERDFSGRFQCIAVYNAYLLGLLTSLILVCIERILLVKYPTKHRNFSDNLTSAIVIFSWIPCIFYLCVKLIAAKHPIRHFIIFRAFLLIVGEILLISLNYAVYYHAKQYDACVKERTTLPQQSERMLNGCSFVIGAVISCSILWLPLVVIDFLVLKEVMDVRWVFISQHFTPLNSVSHVVLFLFLSRDMKEELKNVFRGVRCRSNWYAI